jgi:hypothetical protein
MMICKVIGSEESFHIQSFIGGVLIFEMDKYGFIMI